MPSAPALPCRPFLATWGPCNLPRPYVLVPKCQHGMPCRQLLGDTDFDKRERGGGGKHTKDDTVCISRLKRVSTLFHEPACALGTVPELHIADVLWSAEDLIQHSSRPVSESSVAVRTGRTQRVLDNTMVQHSASEAGAPNAEGSSGMLGTT